MTPVSLRAFLHENRIAFPVGVDAPGIDPQDPIPVTMRAWVYDSADAASEAGLSVLSQGVCQYDAEPFVHVLPQAPRHGGDAHGPPHSWVRPRGFRTLAL